MVITDLYHPYQDPGDNMDLIMGFGLPDVDLKAVLLDITDAFRKDTADHPTLWKDPRGPREAGIIPVEQLSYIFNKKVPYGIGPLSMMKSEEDRMEYLPDYEQEAIDILLEVLKKSKEPVEVLSFGSARILAVAYNRAPKLMKQKIHKIHLSAGTASKNHKLGSDAGANAIPGGEWNVALDVFAFNRILKSDLPVAIYPCAGKDGGFVKDCNNTYWKLPDMDFIRKFDVVICDVWGKVEGQFKELKERGITTAFDCATYLESNASEKAIPYTDYLFYSTDENDNLQLREQMKKIHEKGPKYVICMMGTAGSMCYDGKDFHRFGIIPCEEVVDSMGAGDSYIAGFLKGMTEGKSVEAAMEIGATNATETLKYFGAW